MLLPRTQCHKKCSHGGESLNYKLSTRDSESDAAETCPSRCLPIQCLRSGEAVNMDLTSAMSL